MSEHLWEIALLVIGLLLSGIGTLLGMNLQSIKKCMKKLSERIDGQDTSLTEVKKNHTDLSLSTKEGFGNILLALSTCKTDCQRNFVPDATFLREIGYMRRTLDGQTASLNRMEGQLAITEKLPAIVGEISRNIVSEMQKKG